VPVVPVAPIQIPSDKQTTPEYGAYTPPGWNVEKQGPWKPPTKGGRNPKARRNQTRRVNPDKYRQYASLFASVWNSHSKV